MYGISVYTDKYPAIAAAHASDDLIDKGRAVVAISILSLLDGDFVLTVAWHDLESMYSDTLLAIASRDAMEKR